MKSLAEVSSATIIFVAVAYAMMAQEPRARSAPSRADLKLQASVWSPVGVRTRWRAHQ